MDEQLTEDKQKELDIVKNKVAEAIDKDFVEDITRDNKMEFTYEGVKYRIAKPNYEQKQQIYRERVKKFTELLKDSSFSLEKDLKKTYLLRDIDIESMTNKIKVLQAKKEDIQFKLGELLKVDASEKDCNILKSEIESIVQEQTNIALEKQSYLEFSIENQVTLHMYNFMTYLITEKQTGENWSKAFKNFDEFMKSDENLVGKLAFLITMTYQDGI